MCLEDRGSGVCVWRIRGQGMCLDRCEMYS